MKNVANLITISRIFMSVILLFFLNNTTIFIPVYLICGISDFIDGYIARKTNTTSNLGARLDSLADLLMFIVLLLYVFLHIGEEIRNYLPFIIIIILIRTINILIAYVKFHAFVVLHTWCNKITGISVFLIPLFMNRVNRIYLYIVFIVGTISALEEGLLHLLTSKPNLNRRSIFFD
ncbi:CDP-alcohol phosphatidyltransferase family protein [Mobilitalea sibirica]|uniref:Phosphatidylglycerophosphate synthase n=1 Tax=Mobilitalea sibirica TaxID=1462919 RepID=A0A8J7L1X8_9FIRM|nr:CDP-alcohol phosphatidyltransferase family protein [Mobilitalea sibirica]MBH1939518.1 CDP-alcohol phosphatidyltransferase family protein [Mobilitalea sibirica]